MDDYLSKPFATEDLSRVLLKWRRGKGAPKDTVRPDTALLITAPAAGTPRAATPNMGALDMELIGRLRSTNASLLARLIETYLNYAPRAIEQIKAGVSAKNTTAILQAAHSLKSSSANVGAGRLSNACRQLEALMKSEAGASSEACQPLAAGLDQEFIVAVQGLLDIQKDMSREPAASKTPAASRGRA